MKRLLALFLALFLLFSFASCNGDGEGTGGEGENNGGEGENNGGSVIEKKDPVVTDVGTAKDVYTFQKSVHSKDGYALPYRMYVPDDYSEECAYPLVVFLHGAGERGRDNSLQLKNAVQKIFNDTDSPVYQSIFIAPQCPEGEQWVNTPFDSGTYNSDEIAETAALSVVMDLIASLQRNYSINPDRIYVMGISMGGYGTWDLLVRHTDTFAAAIPICGGADASKASLLTATPIKTFHGTADYTVPKHGTESVVSAILAAGGTSVSYEAMEGKGHSIWDDVVTKDGLFDWLFAQRKS